MKKTLSLLFVIVINSVLFSCSNDLDIITSQEQTKSINDSILEKDLALEKFALILSKATYHNKSLRAFLQKEAIKQFDKNYDILYYAVKDKIIDGKSLRDILISYSSEKEIKQIEENVPLINILIPKIPFFNIAAENLDINDKEIPVALSKKKTTALYLNGKKEVDLEKGEVPDFHVFVINENSRVTLSTNTTNVGNRIKTTNKTFYFKSPNYDGTKKDINYLSIKNIELPQEEIGNKAIEAYSFFNNDNDSITHKSLQRFYIYYGITPQKKEGWLNPSVSEYIGTLEINPKAYFKIADQIKNISPNNDPYVIHDRVGRTKGPLTQEEIIDKLWTKGAYNFQFEIVYSTNNKPISIYIPLKPEDIWNFNLKVKRRHKTFFRHTRYTYYIDPKDFTAKIVHLSPEDISFSKWDISKEALERYVNIFEEDEGTQTQETIEYEHSIMNKSSLTANGKYVSASNESQQNNRYLHKVVTTRTDKSDDLGSIKIYFKDPIIDNISYKNGIKQYQVHTYNTGTVKFSIIAK